MTFHSHARKPKLGTWLVSCDVCGIIHLNTQVKKRWDNLFVCEDDWEKDHPQKFIKIPRERIAAPFQRVESVDGTGNSFIPLCTVFSNQAVAGAAEAGCSVAGTWRLVDNGGSLLAPPSTPSGPSALYPDYTSLMYLFRGEGLANNRLANTAPAYLSVFQPSGTAEGLSNQVGYFGVGTSWPANSNRTGWNTLSSGSFPAGAIDTINFSAGCWYFSPTVGDNGRGFVLFNFNNQVNIQIRVGGTIIVFTVQSQYWVSNVNDIPTPVDLVGWNHIWFKVDNGVVTLYVNGVSFYTTTITLVNPSVRFYIPTQPTMEILNVLENHTTGSVDELVFLRNIGINPPLTSAPFPITPEPPPAPGAKRFWRLINFTIPGGSFLEISELRLTVSGVDQLDGIISSSTAPSFSTIAEIYDNNVFTRPYWPEATVENPAFSITWEYPSSRLITGFKQAGFDTSTRYISDCTCQSSDDGITWTTFGSASGLTYPGNNTLSSNILFVI